MSEEVVLGLDLGSSGVKGVALDVDQGLVATATRPVHLSTPRPGWAEADPEEWWNATREVIATVSRGRRVRAIAVSGMVPAVVLADESGRTLRPAILQNDARAVVEIEELRSRLADVDLLRLTGSALTQQSVAPTLVWLARHEPDTWRRVHSVLGSYDWIAQRLGARPHVEENWAIESGLYDLHSRPLEDVARAANIRWPEMLEVARPGELVGVLDPALAAEWGCRNDVALVVGGADHVLSALGAGLTQPGDVLVKLGGAGDILAVSEQPVFDPRLYLDAHPREGTWLPNGCMATSGSLLAWERELFGETTFETLEEAARLSRPGELLALPYFLGEKTPLHDPDLRGALIGLHLASTKGDIHRAFLESIAYAFRTHLDVMSEHGLEATTVRVTNGGSRSRLWREIVADVLGRPLHSIINHPGASFGAAVLAALGVGLVDSLDVVRHFLEAGELIEPRAELRDLYDERYRLFQEWGAASTPVAHALARGQR